MKKFIIFLLCVAIIGTGGFFGYKKYKQSQDDKKVVDVVPVSLMAESADMFSWYDSEMSGEITSANSQKIYVDNDKLIKKVYVSQGDEVKKGDTILEYDMTVLDLELAQKENQVSVIEQNIKMAQKELEEIKNYKPSESAPKDTDYSDEDYDSDSENYEEPEIYDDLDIPDTDNYVDTETDTETAVEPVETVDVVKASFVPVSGIGTEDDPYIINCNLNTRVASVFMARLISTKKCADLYVYDDNSNFLYKWAITPDNVTLKDLTDWCVSDAVIIDEDTGLLSVSTQAKSFGQLYIAYNSPDLSYTDDSDTYLDDEDMTDSSYLSDEDLTDYTLTDYEDSDLQYDSDSYTDTTSSDSMDYVYSKAEIQNMITEQESEIKGLEIDLKSAKLEYENAKKQKSDGKVVATVDGVVKKIGTASDTEDSEEDEYYEEDSDSSAFAIIEGDGGVEVKCYVSELNLDKAQIGDSLTVMSWMTGGSTTAEVTAIDSEPYSYEAQNWGDSPNNSTYCVHAKLDDSTDFNVGDWVSVTLAQTETSNSNSVYLPIHYVRQDGGDYYIMKADDNGKLVKQYVKAGQIMYGYYIEIKGGLSMSDKICFPYGTDVKEGIKTKDSTEVLYPENY